MIPPSEKVILVVDDESRMVRFVRMNLELEGYLVAEAGTGMEALEKVRDELPDLVLLDVMMPRLGGFDALRAIRGEDTVPVLMLTARGDDVDRIVGLELGADDYLPKPCNPRELVARVRAILRRTGPAEEPRHPPPTLAAGDIELDPARRTTTVGGAEVTLTATEFNLLRTLLESPGYAFTRSELIEQALGYEYEGSERTLDSHMRNLRRKIEPTNGEPTYIQTVYGVGYRLAGP